MNLDIATVPIKARILSTNATSAYATVSWAIIITPIIPIICIPIASRAKMRSGRDGPISVRIKQITILRDNMINTIFRMILNIISHLQDCFFKRVQDVTNGILFGVYVDSMNKNKTAVIGKIHRQCTWSKGDQRSQKCYLQVCFQLCRNGNNAGFIIQFRLKYHFYHINIGKYQFPKEYKCQFDKSPDPFEIEIKNQKAP